MRNRGAPGVCTVAMMPQKPPSMVRVMPLSFPASGWPRVPVMASLLFVLVPFIPGVRSIPRWVPVHRLIWRDYYRSRPG